jgi:hypothetical protein
VEYFARPQPMWNGATVGTLSSVESAA